MPVNYQTPAAEQLKLVPGVQLGVTEAGIRKANRRDLTLITLAPGAQVAGVFTTNRFCAAPVQVCREHLVSGDIRALVINTGIANAGTGEQGMQTARASCEAVARALNVNAAQVLPFSTGVIMEPLPVDRLERGLPGAIANLAENNWHAAAHAIMTTDTVAKAASRQLVLSGKTITVTGISKGAGMIKPNMATMLGFVATDAAVTQDVLAKMVKSAADVSFNCVTVDGDTSTNDSFVLMASGAAGNAPINNLQSADAQALLRAVTEVAMELSQAIVRDGEGATKFITVAIKGGKTHEECKAVGYWIAHSPLVKTAFFASDPNLGRILAAIGNAGAQSIPDLDTSKVKLWIGDVLVSLNGGRNPDYREEQGAAVMQPAEITITVDLGRGDVAATLWTCDFSYDYVKINADYRS